MPARILFAAATAASLLISSQSLAQSAPAAAPAPPAAPASAPAVALAPSPGLTAGADIMSTLRANPHFTILVKALDAANIASVLGTPGLTLFAPTDEAFKALPPATASALMATANAATLQRILAYHLVHTDLDTSKIKGAKGPVPTVEGQPIQIDGSGEVLLVNDAHIIQADVKPPGETIQVIDKVLVPSDVQLPQ